MTLTKIILVAMIRSCRLIRLRSALVGGGWAGPKRNWPPRPTWASPRLGISRRGGGCRCTTTLRRSERRSKTAARRNSCEPPRALPQPPPLATATGARPQARLSLKPRNRHWVSGRVATAVNDVTNGPDVQADDVCSITQGPSLDVDGPNALASFVEITTERHFKLLRLQDNFECLESQERTCDSIYSGECHMPSQPSS